MSTQELVVLITLSRHFSLTTDLCLSRTVGQMEVGGRTCVLYGPSRQSGDTWLAHRLWSWKCRDVTLMRGGTNTRDTLV